MTCLVFGIYILIYTEEKQEDNLCVKKDSNKNISPLYNLDWEISPLGCFFSKSNSRDTELLSDIDGEMKYSSLLLSIRLSGEIPPAYM